MSIRINKVKFIGNSRVVKVQSQFISEKSMDEEDSPEWRRANTKGSSRASKRISDSDVTSDGEEIIELNEATDYEVHDTVGYEHKYSTITLGDTQSEDMTLDRKEDNSITNWKGKEKMDEDDRPSDSQCKNDTLKSQEEGTMKTRSGGSDKDNKSELSDDLDNEGVDTNEESVMQKVDKGTSNSEEEAGSEIEADDANEGITSRNEQDDGTSEINSLNEEINENIPDQIKTEDRDSIEENYRIIKENNTKILTITQTQGPQLDLDTSQMEESRINVTILDQESDNVTVHNKGYDVGLQKKYNNQILHLSRSVSEPTYRYLFKDPLDDLNDLLEAKQNRDSTVTDSAMAKPSNPNPEKEESSKWDQLESEEENPVPEQINSNALSRNATTYELERFKKNALIIFNQENIIGYKPRLGTKQDAEVLSNTFGNYGFEIEEHPDLCRDEIFRELKKFSERDFTDYGCIAVAILTHGSNMGALKAKDRTFYEKDVINFLKAQGRPTLVTKPKVIIIQACRGSKYSEAAHVMRLGKLATDHEDRMQQPYTIPVEADTLVMHSTYVGNTSLRDETNGSWFIQTLCSKINELAATQDLEAILTDVKREVAIDKVYEVYNRVTHEIEYNKQMPVVTSTLIRKLYLNQYRDELTVIKTSETSELDNTNVVEDTLRKTYRPSISQPGVEDLPPVLPCICFLDRFEYYRDCMSYFVEENPDDETAKSFLDLAEVLQEGSEFNASKERISRAIRNHLQKNAKEFDYFKYLYFYKD